MKSVAALLMATAMSVSAAFAAERRISVEEYRDRMEAWWIGQIAGVGVGGPSRFETFRNPGPLAGSKYTEAEMSEIRFLPQTIKTKLDDRWGIESKARD